MLDELSYPVFKEFKKVYKELDSLKRCISCVNSGVKLLYITYTGDGITTTFNIPSGAVLAFVTTDGRVNTPIIEYTVSGTVVTFIGAPAIGSNIILFYQL